MNARICSVFTGTFTGLALALLASGAPTQLAVAAQRADDGERALVAAYNASGSALFGELSAASGNIVISPLSIGTAMAMALSGARAETEREMADVLKQRLDRPAMEAASRALRMALGRYEQSAAAPRCPRGLRPSRQADRAPGDAHCEAAAPATGACPPQTVRVGDLCVAKGSAPRADRLVVANALMLARRGDQVAADYAALLEHSYGAELFRGAGLGDINNWVKHKTEGKIERILDQLDPTAAAVILNAVYFKGGWGEAFSKSDTADAAFNLSPQKKVSLPTMRRSGRYALVARPLYRALRLPYALGQIGMIIVLPNEIGGLDAVNRALAADEWSQLAAALQAHDAVKPVDLALPRFKASFTADLATAFREAGMTRAFDLKRADFSGMTGLPPSQAPLAIGSIVHRAVVDVTEDGTEAAASTAVSVDLTAMYHPPEPQEVFHVDHPFLFAIIDDASGAILFQGRIEDPRGMP